MSLLEALKLPVPRRASAAAAKAAGPPAMPQNASGGTEAEERQRRYEEVLPQVERKYKALPDQPIQRLAPLKQALDATYAEMKTAAADGDHARALSQVEELSANLEDYAKAVAEFNDRKSAFDKDLAAFQPRFAEASTSQGSDDRAQGELLAGQQQMEKAVAAGDYALAQKWLGALKAKVATILAARQQQAAEDASTGSAAALAQQRQDYERSLALLKARLPTTTLAAPGRIAELQKGMQDSLAKADAAASSGDYKTAFGHLNTLERQLDEFDKLNELRLRYESRREQVEANLPAAGQNGDRAVLDVLKKIETLRARADAKAKTGDFGGALTDVEAVRPLLARYQDLVNLGGRFHERWKEVKPRLPTTTPSDASPATVKTIEAIVKSGSAIEAAAASGDYEKGLNEIEHVVELLATLDEAKQKGARARADFQNDYALLKKSVDEALNSETGVKEVKARQNELAARKKALDDAVARNDFDAAKAQLAVVQSALDAFLDERRKSPVNKNTVRDMAGRLGTAINRKYMTSQAKVNAAATAYDAALAKHKAAVKKVDDKKQLAADIAAGVFFAALGGFAGGAVGGVVKGPIEAAFKSKAAAGGIVDATKDVAKYLTRTTEKLRGPKVGDPTSISAKVGGNGTELARGIGAAVNEQGAKLLETVEQWYNILLESDKASPSDDTIRVDLEAGDPYDSVVNDAFLKILAGISGTEADFSRALWAQWIDDYAYTIDQQCTEWGDCKSVVSADIEGFFAWWGDLTNSIQEQTGQDFGLRARLDAAKKNVKAKADAENDKNFFTR